MPSSSPTVRRRRLASKLRDYREAAGLTCDQVGEQVGSTGSRISKIENGKLGIRPGDVRELLELYGVHGPELDEMVSLAREARQRGWWHKYTGTISEEYATYIGLESEATSLRIFEPSVVHGLFQTEEYARAVICGGFKEISDEEITRRTELRMTRQERLTREPPLRLWTILDEACLRRVVGSPDVTKRQLLRVVELAETPLITVQVVPFAVGNHPGTLGSFTILSFAEPSDPDVVYVETRGGDLYLERETDVHTCNLAFDHLRALALSPDDSTAMIARVARETS